MLMPFVPHDDFEFVYLPHSSFHLFVLKARCECVCGPIRQQQTNNNNPIAVSVVAVGRSSGCLVSLVTLSRRQNKTTTFLRKCATLKIENVAPSSVHSKSMPSHISHVFPHMLSTFRLQFNLLVTAIHCNSVLSLPQPMAI